MKRTAPMLTAVLCVLLCAVVGYVFFSLRASMKPSDATDSPGSPSADGIAVSGLIVRREQPLVSSLPHTRLIAAEGQRVGASDALGCAFLSEEALRRSGALEALLSALQTAASPPTARTARFSLAGSLARGDMASLALSVRAVRYAMLPGGAGDARRDEALLLERIGTLRPGGGGDAVLLTAPAAGFFSAHCDGLESLDPSALSALTPDALARLLSGGGEPADAYGRLITGSEWCFAALVSAGDAARFAPGGTVLLDIPGLAGPVRARIRSVSEATDGRCAAVFSCREALAEVLSLRYTAAIIRAPNTEILPQ